MIINRMENKEFCKHIALAVSDIGLGVGVFV